MERASNLQHLTTSNNLSGWLNGFIGVVIFSGSLPATRVAVQQEFGVGEGQPVGLRLQRMAFVGMGLQLGPGVGEAALAQSFVFVVHGSGRRGQKGERRVAENEGGVSARWWLA